jgi:VanZ family protein
MQTPRSALTAARVALVCAAVFTLFVALTPPQDHPLQLLPWEKGDHCLAFYTLAVLGAMAAPRLPLSLLGVLLVAFGGLIELLQGLPMIGRDSRIQDVFVDGAAAAVALMPIAVGRWRLGLASRDGMAAG